MSPAVASDPTALPPVAFTGVGIGLPHATYLPNPQEAIPLARFAPRTSDRRVPYWFVSYPDAAAAVRWADAYHVPVHEDVREYARTRWLAELDAMSRSAAPAPTRGEAVAVTGLTSTLLSTQQVVVQAIAHCDVTHPARPQVRHRALLVADDPGLGKTIMSLAGVRITGRECARVVVVCPSGLTQNWVDEMATHFTEGTFTAWIATSRTPSPPPANVDVVVVGWGVVTDWASQLAQWKPDALIVDEGHFAKGGRYETVTQEKAKVDDAGVLVRDASGHAVRETVTTVVAGTARATALIDLAGALIADGALILALTGTPIVNRPLELLALLELLGLLHLVGGHSGYKNRYCGPTQTLVGGSARTSYTGASHLLELHSRLAASGHYVRRRKLVLVDAGLLRRKYVDGVYVYDDDSRNRPSPWLITATAAQMKDYRAAEEDAEDFFTTAAREILRETHEPLQAPVVQQRIAQTGYKNLTRITELRKLAGLTKAPYVIDAVQAKVEAGEKVVVAAHHRELVDAYAAAFTGLKIQGGMKLKDVEKAKALFNETGVREHPVMVLSIEAGKTGHTLCKQAAHGAGPACALMAVAEQVWTPGDENQLQDRIWRIGQDREVHIVNMLLDGTIDQAVYASRARKRRVFNAVVDGIDDTTEKAAERVGAGMIAQQLALQGVARRAA